jgi:hypothetical protein
MEDTQMTIFDAINRIDAIKPNSLTQLEKIRALSTLDGIIKDSIIDTHEGSENVVFAEYTQETALTTELLVPAPYDVIYLYWLESTIDYWNGETGKYNNSIELYNTAYSEFERYYNRTHVPKGKKFKYF